MIIHVVIGNLADVDELVGAFVSPEAAQAAGDAWELAKEAEGRELVIAHVHATELLP